MSIYLEVSMLLFQEVKVKLLKLGMNMKFRLFILDVYSDFSLFYLLFGGFYIFWMFIWILDFISTVAFWIMAWIMKFE